MDASHPVVELVELSRTLRLSRRWLKREIAAGHIPYLQAGHKRLFNTNAVRDALAARAAGEGARHAR